MYHQIVLLSRIEDVSRTEHAVRAVWRARGFDLAKDVYLQHQAFVASMPCTLTPGIAEGSPVVRPCRHQDRRQRGNDVPPDGGMEGHCDTGHDPVRVVAGKS
jgi:hypothetical protein